MDANFGLVRKLTAGKSVEEPKHPSKFFVSPKEVQSFVESISDTRVGIPQVNLKAFAFLSNYYLLEPTNLS